MFIFIGDPSHWWELADAEEEARQKGQIPDTWQDEKPEEDEK